MVNYLGKFIPNVDEHTTPLRNLFKKVVVFELQKPQLDAIKNLQPLGTSAPCLKIADPKLSTRLRTDASSIGLGSFLKQNYGTVDQEKRYPIDFRAQIEKEILSMIFGVECFHDICMVLDLL